MEVRPLPGGGTRHCFIAEARAKPRPGKPALAKPTRAAREYIESEERHQRRKRPSSSKKAPPRVTHSFIEEAKRKRAHYKRYSSESRLADFPLSPFEGWELEGIRDVTKAVTAVEVGAAKGPDEDRIKAWIYWRAEALGCAELVPPGWKGVWQ